MIRPLDVVGWFFAVHFFLHFNVSLQHLDTFRIKGLFTCILIGS